MHILKKIPEDFIVEEIAPKSRLLKESGKYLICLLKKKSLTTHEIIEIISKKLNLPIKNIGYAGIKDKNAITIQYISLKGKGKDSINNIYSKDIELKPLGFLDEPISLGDLEKNKFSITVRNIDTLPETLKKNTKDIIIPNYYGEQRFSTNNIEIGRKIIKKKFKETCEIISKGNGKYEKDVKDYLEKKQTDYVGAIKKIPFKIIKLYIHSYQSYLWNKVLSLTTKKHNKIPLIGFGTEIKELEIKELYKIVMKEEEITIRDFIIRQLPELSLEGEERDAYIEVKDLEITNLEDDEFYENKKKVTLEFSLPKGSYATVAIDYIFNKNKLKNLYE
jgi:tRNA pseudouridine13 synthase